MMIIFDFIYTYIQKLQDKTIIDIFTNQIRFLAVISFSAITIVIIKNFFCQHI